MYLLICKICIPITGRPFVIRHEGSWQRVLIEEIISVSESMAYFVDTGLRSAVSSKQLLPIQDRYHISLVFNFRQMVLLWLSGFVIL